MVDTWLIRTSPSPHVFDALHRSLIAGSHSYFRTAHRAEDCLVGHWVGPKRWLLLDLTAGGSDWGPALGGDGVVGQHSMPKAGDYFGQLLKDKKGELEWRNGQELTARHNIL